MRGAMLTGLGVAAVLGLPVSPAGATPVTGIARGAALTAPAAVAPGGRLVLQVDGVARPLRVEELRASEWVARGGPVPHATLVGLRAPMTPGRLRLRAHGADGRVSRSVAVRVRPLALAAVGDVNLGDGPGADIASHGAAWPWLSVGPVLRAADIAIANLECAVSRRGSAQPKTFTFRGNPASVPAMARVGGIDAVTLANNHAGDFGTNALLDGLAALRGAGIVAFGAGRNAAEAYAPRIVTALGLRVALLGFSVIEPENFRATDGRPGTAWGFDGQVAAAVRRASREADVVIAFFHWGIEREFTEDAAQRHLASVALGAGATAVIGSHPHVLQPIRRPPGHLIAYSLGNFVFSPHAAGTERTGILHVSLARGRVLGAHLQPAVIRGTQPQL